MKEGKMGICIISDVHGSKNWREAQQQKEKFNKIIFVGDYFDTYFPEKITRKDELENFEKIIKFKKENPDKVILLLGNHDLNQYILKEPMSRKAEGKYFDEIRNTLLKYKDLFSIVYKVKDKEGKEWIITHAGITKDWWEKFGFKDIEDINKAYKEEKYEVFEWSYTNPFDTCGVCSDQSCMWIRPESLVSNAMFPNQIVGHTRMKERPFMMKNSKTNDHVLLIDGTECAVINLDME